MPMIRSCREEISAAPILICLTGKALLGNALASAPNTMSASEERKMETPIAEMRAERRDDLRSGR